MEMNGSTFYSHKSDCCLCSVYSIYVFCLCYSFKLRVISQTNKLLYFSPPLNAAEDPIYANTRPVANKQPSPRPGMKVQPLKTASSSQNLRLHPSPGARYEDGKRRFKR